MHFGGLDISFAFGTAAGVNTLCGRGCNRGDGEIEPRQVNITARNLHANTWPKDEEELKYDLNLTTTALSVRTAKGDPVADSVWPD